jgi:hypothetical protein
MKLRPITEEEWLSLKPGDVVYWCGQESDWRRVVVPPTSIHRSCGKYDSPHGEGNFSYMYDYRVSENFKMKKAAEKTSTYIIWNKGSNLPPKVTFTNRQEAIKAAYSMASKFPGERFNVCKLVGHAEVASVKYEDYEA